jgi:hypothetical protein
MMTIWILYSYDNGYPTVPLSAYGSPQAAFADLGGVWREVPGGWGGRGGHTSHDHDGVALELVAYKVKMEE